MSKTGMVYALPRAGLKVPDPAVKGKPSRDVMLPAGGKYVQDGAFWHRREREGDVRLFPSREAAVSVLAAEEAAAETAEPAQHEPQESNAEEPAEMAGE